VVVVLVLSEAQIAVALGVVVVVYALETKGILHNPVVQKEENFNKPLLQPRKLRNQ